MSNLWNEAVEAANEGEAYAESLNFLYGQLMVEIEAVNLEKGKPKTAWDAELHSPDNKVIEINMMLDTLGEMNYQYTVQYSVFANSADWYKTAYGSLQDLGIDHPSKVDGLWVKAKKVNSFRKPYITTDSEGNSRQVQPKMLTFLAVYADHDDCVRGFHADRGEKPTLDNPTAGLDSHDDAVMSVDMEPENDTEKATALEFAKVLVAQCNGDLEKLATDIDGMEIVSKHFNVDSPEIIELLKAQAVPA